VKAVNTAPRRTPDEYRPHLQAAPALGVYVAGWIALGSYELSRIRADGIALIAASSSVALGFLVLLTRGPAISARRGMVITPRRLCGFLLVCPLALPLGLASAAFLVNGVLSTPHSLLQVLALGHTAQNALAYGFLTGLPLLIGVVFLVVG
jgi:hypothetical protein